MIEFLSENARRAYPLARQVPDGVDERIGFVLVDACIGYGKRITGDEQVSLISVAKDAATGGALFRIGLSSSDFVDVAIKKGVGEFATVFGSSTNYKALLTVRGTVLDDLLPSLTNTAINVGIPFAVRCVSAANRFVTAISAYAPDKCTTPHFTGTEEPVAVVAGIGTEATLVSKDGIDIDTTTLDSVDGDILRVSAITAQETSESGEDVDIMIRGDDCITVEAMPGYYAASGTTPRRFNEPGSPYSSETDCGVIVIGTKCKPCCQCEDYEDATKMLRPAETAAVEINDELNAIKALYEQAVETFNAAKEAAKAALASYNNIHASATAVASGGLYEDSGVVGMRSRLAVTLTISNMTLETATIDGLSFTIPDYPAKPIKVQWATAGESPNPMAGTSLRNSSRWTLNSGDSLVLVATYAKGSDSNTGYKPSSGMTATFKMHLRTRTDIPDRPESQERVVTIK